MNLPFVAAESFLFATFEFDFMINGELHESRDVELGYGVEPELTGFGNGEAMRWSILDGLGSVFGEVTFFIDGTIIFNPENDRGYPKEDKNEENEDAIVYRV